MPTVAWIAAATACIYSGSLPCLGRQAQTEETKVQGPQVEGRLVTQVRVVDEAGKSVSERIPPLPLDAGKPFDFAVERESLRKLYAMGDFSDIHVNTVGEASGVVVNFVVKQNFYNNVIRIEGLKEPPTEAAALAALRLNLGEPFR